MAVDRKASKFYLQFNFRNFLQGPSTLQFTIRINWGQNVSIACRSSANREDVGLFNQKVDIFNHFKNNLNNKLSSWPICNFNFRLKVDLLADLRSTHALLSSYNLHKLIHGGEWQIDSNQWNLHFSKKWWYFSILPCCENNYVLFPSTKYTRESRLLRAITLDIVAKTCWVCDSLHHINTKMYL